MLSAVHGAEGSVPWGERSGVEAGLTALVGCWPHTRVRAHTHTLLHPVRARGLVLEHVVLGSSAVANGVRMRT
jgi:hypothetical protein